MIQLSGIFSESLGGTCTIRGYAKYNEIVELSYPHPGYQRPAEDEHVAEISSFITSGSNSFSPEVVLAYTAKYNYYAQGASSEVDALADIRSGKGFTSNVDGIAFKKEKAAGNGFLYTLSIPDKKYDRIEDKPFRRVDGNHRLLAIEKLIAEGQMRSNYLIPFCIIVFPDNVSMKDEKIIFHNINSKAVPIRSERLLEGIIVDSKDELSFSDKELDDSFGHEYLLARKVLKNKPLAIRKLKAIPWIRSDLITALIDIIESIQKRFGNIQTAEHEEAFGIALSNALNDAKLGENGTLLISSGLLFLLVALYYNIEISSPSADAVQYKDAYTDSLLCYSDYCIDFLKAKNTPINEDFSLHPQFESPTFDYYENVKDFMTEEKWTGLGTPLLSMLAAESNEIVRSHFFSYNDHYYPLFNPSLVIDYQTKILLTRPDRELHSIVISSLADKLASIYDSHDIKTDYTIRKPLLLDNKQPLLDNKKSFAYLEDSNLIVFLDCGNEHRIEEEISAIYKAHTEDGLSIVDLEARIPGKGYKAYHVDKECKLSIICFDEHINVDQPRIVLRGREEKRIYTAIDLMYMLMFSSEVSQIAEFDSDEKNSESQVLSWGGASDYFTVFLSEKGFISKGAIEYSNVYSEVDTSAAHIFSHYLELGGVFPFHLSSTIFADPECWNVICDDNSVYQFTRKVKALPGGALFKYDNGCSVFLSYNFFSILKESNITQSRLSLDMFRAVTEKFFIEYHQDLSAIPPLANTLVQFCCHSLSNQNPEHYVCCQKAKVSSNKLVVDFEVNSSKIASDIAEAIDRSVEYSVIGELLQPLVCLSKDSYSELFEKMELTSGQKKTLGTTAVRIDYYFNPDTYEIKETDVSELSIRKQIAKICAAAGGLPGTYERRDATEIVRKIQESVVSHLEQAIRTLERDRLHILLLSALATEQLSVNLNRTGATLTEDIEEGERIKSLEKSTQLSEKAKMRKSALLYLIETNLYLVNERKEEAIDSSKLSELLSFAKWIIYLQNSSDLCFHTDSDTKLIVEDDYRIDVELGENYSQTFEKESQRRIIAEPFNLRGDNTDRDFFEKVANAFYEDLGVHFKVLESVLHHLSDSSFSHDNVEFDEIAPNVIKAKATDVLNDYLSFVVENVPVEDVKSAYDFLTIVPGQLKTICDTTR